MLRKLFFASGLIPVLSLTGKPSDPLFLVYSFFVLGYFLRDRLAVISQKLRIKENLKFALLITIVGIIAEGLAWGNNFLAARPNPALFHPQLIYDLMIGIAQYGAWGIVWGFLIKKYRYSLLEVFTIQGLYGVLLEQKGAIFIQGLLNLPLGIIMWLYVFLVYGSITGLAFILAGFSGTGTGERKWIKYPLTLIALMVASIVMLIGWGLTLKIVNLIPPPQPIWERPIW